jgi:hypothetical protein
MGKADDLHDSACEAKSAERVHLREMHQYGILFGVWIYSGGKDLVGTRLGRAESGEGRKLTSYLIS